MEVRDIAAAGIGTFVLGSVLGISSRSARFYTSCAAAVAAGFISRSAIGLRRTLFPLEEWIDSGPREEALEPELPMIDAHHHLWDARTQPKGWPISSTAITLLYKLRPILLQALIARTLPPEIIRTFSHWNPFIIPYMADEMLQDIDNIPHGGGGPRLAAHNIRKTVSILQLTSIPSHPPSHPIPPHPIRM